MARRRLGKGLDALISARSGAQEMVELPLDELHPSAHQPRQEISPQRLSELAASIKETGVLQPVIARMTPEGYEIVAGERRWRAARMAGLSRIPVVLRDVSEQEALTMALVENLQREDLNPIEKARAFKNLLATLGLTQTKAAGRLGISRVALSNTLRLLELPARVKELLARGKLTAGHARALLMLKDPARAEALAGRIIEQGLSVRQVEEIASGRPRRAKTSRRARAPKGPQIVAIEQELSQITGTKVRIERGPKGGKLVIEFYSPDDFEEILALIRKGAKAAR